MTLKRGLKNKAFCRQKRGSGNSGQKEKHVPWPGKAQRKKREAEQNRGAGDTGQTDGRMDEWTDRCLSSRETTGI